MSEWFFHAGRWKKGQGSVPLDDRLFRFGDGFFETVRVEDGEARFWPLHLARIQRSLQRLRLPARDPEIFPLPRARGVFALRLFFSSGRGGGLNRRGELTLYAGLSPYTAPSGALRAASFVRRERAFSDLKTTAYLEAIMALVRTRTDDLIACDERGRVLESASGNVFACIDGKWWTPPLDGRILPGVTRTVLLPVCRERRLRLEALFSAEAVVLSSALRGIAVLSRLDGKALGRDTSALGVLEERYRKARGFGC